MHVNYDWEFNLTNRNNVSINLKRWMTRKKEGKKDGKKQLL